MRLISSEWWICRPSKVMIFFPDTTECARMTSCKWGEGGGKSGERGVCVKIEYQNFLSTRHASCLN